jgi:hypothetical protein
MKFVPVTEQQLDPVPQGFARINEAELDADPEEIGAGETFAQNATNVFGAGPVLVAALQHIVNGRPYQEVKNAYRARMEAGAEQNPKAALAGKVGSIVPETILGGAAGKAISGASKFAGITSKVAPWAANNPVMAHVLEGIAGGGAYGAASGAGEAASEDRDIAEGALKGGAGGAVVGGGLGAIFGGLSKFARGAAEREETQIVKGALKGDEARAVRGDVVSLLRGDPELRSIIARDAAESVPKLRQRLEEIASKRAVIMDTIDDGAGISLGRFAKSIDTEIAELSKTPLQEGAQKALEGLKTSILKAWAPPELREALASDLAKESTVFSENMLKRLDKVNVPSKRFLELERSAEDAFNGQQKIAVQKAIGGAIANHVESSTDKIAKESLDKLSRDYSALSAITESVGSRTAEPVEGMHKLLSIFTHHGPVGAAVALASGHPIPAAVLAAPALAKKGNQVLAYLEREAAAGNQKAIKVLKAAEAAKTVGTAGAGAVGSAQAGTLSETNNAQ